MITMKLVINHSAWMGVKYEIKPSQIITLNIVPPAFFEVTKCFKIYSYSYRFLRIISSSTSNWLKSNVN